MRRHLALALTFASSTLALAGCGGPSECTDPNTPGCLVASAQERITSPSVSSSDLDAAVAGNTAFALDLHQTLGAATPGKNLFFSPFSVSSALAMVWAGARGATATQMATTLHFTLDAAKLHPAFNQLDLAFAGRGQDAEGQDGHPFALTVSNALWGQLGYPFEAPFLDTLALNYGAGMHVVDFVGAPAESAKIINDWVAERTEDKIQNLVGDITEGTKLIVTNAIYFNARWATPFEAGYTQPAEFTRDGGSKATVEMMSATVGAGYGEGAGYQALALPYDGGELSMVVILPEAGKLDAFEAGLTPETLAAITGGIHSTDVSVWMPRFQMDTSYELADPLRQLGMVDAFDAADFSGISTKSDLYISRVAHKAYIEVNESGTEAAAATSVEMGDGAAYEPGSEIHLDHPFLFFIRDDATNSILFMGRVADPT